jgi:hypothetical protein
VVFTFDATPIFFLTILNTSTVKGLFTGEALAGSPVPLQVKKLGWVIASALILLLLPFFVCLLQIYCKRGT